LQIKPEDFSENINSDSTSFFCEDNNLKGNSANLNYGTLNSNFNLNIPFNKSSNKIDLKGSVGYVNSLNPDIELSGNVPYTFDRREINFGDINSSFIINRTQLSNLNIFRKNDIRGFITAKGELKGKIADPDISINFNVDYPHYKGIRIREIWEGDIKNVNNAFFLNMKNRYSPIPSFISVKFDSEFKLDNANFIRVFNSNKGSIGIVKEDDNYNWRADNFPLDELELSLNKSQFDRIDGIINGEGSISSDQSSLVGRLAWSLGKYRNINLANSLFDFRVKNNYFYINSSLYPIDGGVIEVEFDSNKNEFINSEFTNVSTSWTILTAVDIFNFDNKKVIPISKSNILDDLEINNYSKSFKERIDFINNFIEDSNVLEDKFNLQKYLNKIKIFDAARKELPEKICNLSKEGDQIMIEVERIWLGAYASLLGDVALQELCFGGLWISGGTASKHFKNFKSDLFLKQFFDKGRLKDILKTIPMKVILDDEFGLFIAACRAKMLLKI